MTEWYLPTGASIHDVYAVYRPQYASTFTDSLLNVAGDTNHAIDPGGAATPSWGAGIGWIFNGTTDYLETTFVPDVNQGQSVFIQFLSANVGVGTRMCLAGVLDAAGWFEIEPDDSAVGVRYGNGGTVTTGPEFAAGNLGVSGVYGYRDGIVDSTTIGSWASAPSEPLYIGCINAAGLFPWLFVEATIRSMVIYEKVLTQEQITELVGNMQILGAPIDIDSKVWVPHEENEPTGRDDSDPYGPWR